MIRKLLLSLFFVLLIVLVVSKFGTPVVLASAVREQAFGVRPVAFANGSRASVWTAQHPNIATFRASPVAVCRSLVSPCTDPFIETGFAKGAEVNGNVLTLYSSWTKLDGTFDKNYNIQGLNDNTWYNFMIWRKNQTNPRWIVKLDDVQVYSPVTNPPDWSEGGLVICGAEVGSDNANIAVQCANTQYRQTGGNAVWTLYNFTHTQNSDGYCVDKPADWGVLGWGYNGALC